MRFYEVRWKNSRQREKILDCGGHMASSSTNHISPLLSSQDKLSSYIKSHFQILHTQTHTPAGKSVIMASACASSAIAAVAFSSPRQVSLSSLQISSFIACQQWQKLLKYWSRIIKVCEYWVGLAWDCLTERCSMIWEWTLWKKWVLIYEWSHTSFYHTFLLIRTPSVNWNAVPRKMDQLWEQQKLLSLEEESWGSASLLLPRRARDQSPSARRLIPTAQCGSLEKPLPHGSMEGLLTFLIYLNN